MTSSSTPAQAAGLNRLGSAEAKMLGRLHSAGETGLPRRRSAAEDALVERGLAAERGDTVVLSQEGRARLARLTGGDHGFLAQHRTLETRTVRTERGHDRLLVDLDESPLGWLARRKGRDGKLLLSPAAVTAGERLRADFTRGQMSPRVTANWEAAVASGRRGGAGQGVEVADAVLAARARVTRALEAVGPELSGVLVDVCCFLKGLEEVERDRGWPARGAKVVLGLGLDSLARHYGVREQGGPERSGRVVGWNAPDSRPTIDGA